MNNNTDFKPTNSNSTFRPNSKFPIRFEKLLPGSMFRIVAEPSRNLFRSKDNRLYMKAHDGFFSTLVGSDEGIILYPEDLVMPVVQKNAQRK